jgi:hypothetical protein
MEATLLNALPRELNLGSSRAHGYIAHSGMCVEGNKLWTDGPRARLEFVLPHYGPEDIALTFATLAFVWPNVLLRQSVQISLGEAQIAEWIFLDREPGVREVLVKNAQLPPSRRLILDFSIPDCARPSSFGINNDDRALGFAITRIGWQPVTDYAAFRSRSSFYGRKVGRESRKSFDRKVESGFWSRYVKGPDILDIGFRGFLEGQSDVAPILEGAIGVDIDYPGYDGTTLPFATESQDAVYSSHCLEHISDFEVAIQEWYRVTKFAGHIITVVPHVLLYERKEELPSFWNPDHKRFYTPQSLLAEFEQALPPNSYRVRHLAENDEGYDYSIPPNQHPIGCYEIELVVEKIRPPSWNLLE